MSEQRYPVHVAENFLRGRQALRTQNERTARTTGCESTRGQWHRVRRHWPEHNSRRVNSTAWLATRPAPIAIARTGFGCPKNAIRIND